MSTFKTIFNNKLDEFLKANSDRSGIMNDERYELLIEEIEEARRIKKNRKKTLSSRQYRILKRYDICEVEGTKKLVEKRENDKQNTKKNRFFCKAGEVFDVLESVHYNLGHKSTRAMESKLRKNYCNFTRQVINLYLSLCDKCKSKKTILSATSKIPSIVSNCMESRCQVNLINMQAKPDNEYQFIMNYQDYLTKFTILRPLKSNSAEEVAYQLVNIFSLFGTPCVLQCDNGREFAKTIIDHLANMWRGVKIVHGKSQSSNYDQEIRDALLLWMAENSSEKWSEGLCILQNNINRSQNHGSKLSPYEAMFAIPPKMGLTISKISSGMYVSLNTEEELDLLLKSKRQKEEDEVTDSQSNAEEELEVNDTKSNGYEEATEAKYLKSETNTEESDIYYVQDISEIEKIKIVKLLEELNKEELSPVESNFCDDTIKS